MVRGIGGEWYMGGDCATIGWCLVGYWGGEWGSPRYGEYILLTIVSNITQYIQ